jgi:hypothetical protein
MSDKVIHTQDFKIYNIHNNTQIKINDAVKITSMPQYESFWVEVISVKNNDSEDDTLNGPVVEIIGSVQNILEREHLFNTNDIIKFNHKNVKEHKKEKDRFNLSNLDYKQNFINWHFRYVY